MVPMEHRISAKDLARRLGDVLGRVRYRGDSFVVDRNGEAVARGACGRGPPRRDPRPGFRGRPRAQRTRRRAAGVRVGLVIDTSALVALERAETVWERLIPPELAVEEAVLPAIVYPELLAGVHLADTPARAA